MSFAKRKCFSSGGIDRIAFKESQPERAEELSLGVKSEEPSQGACLFGSQWSCSIAAMTHLEVLGGLEDGPAGGRVRTSPEGRRQLLEEFDRSGLSARPVHELPARLWSCVCPSGRSRGGQCRSSNSGWHGVANVGEVRNFD